jgi:hypothetical protein
MFDFITPERAFAVFKAISDTRAPTLMARHTRGRVIAQLVAEQRGALRFTSNLHGSGAVALELGAQVRKPLWCFAHIDNISFLTGARAANGEYALTPFCEAKQHDGRRAAQALGFDPITKGTTLLAAGWLITRGDVHTFEPAAGSPALPLATRVVYASAAEWDRASGLVHGCIDDAAGAAALTLAAMALAQSSAPVEALFVLSDEEEGPVAPGPQAFARGSARLFHRAPRESLPDLITVTDTHEAAAGSARFGAGACFSAYGSRARGGVTPPALLHALREFAGELEAQGVRLVEHGEYFGRSDDASAVLATQNVALIGCPGAFAHFAQRPHVHIDDLVNLAKTIAALVLRAQDAEWRAAFGE